MLKRFLVSMLALSLFVSVGWAQGLLQEVQERGTLACGVNDRLPGFGSVNEAGEFEGFDVDFCRAIAAAVLGDADAVEFRPLSAQERFTALQTGEVDVLSRNTTWTSSRDTTVGLNFAPTTFYDGQGFMVRDDSGIAGIQDLEGRRIGVQSGTTTELNLADTMEALGIEYTPVVFENADQLVAAYDQGNVDTWTTDKSGLASRLITLQDPDAHRILDVSISKEPLGPAVLHGDDQWFDVVKWVVFGLFEAEEYGITSDNVDQLVESSENPSVQRILGVEPGNVEGIGLPATAIRDAVAAVGNYGEIYARNLGPDTPFDIPRGLNRQYYDGGLIYGMPFR
ncbi:MAG: amino acid ABC transporter substrate-binding protein [Trueperaceae bacterium]|nr:amino acid ABC transporter substrate-binding protein [Trueperaceae bacterium]